MKALLGLIFISFLMFERTTAQTTKVDQTIKDAGSTFQTISGLFPKKKKKTDTDNSNDQASNSSTSKSNSNGNDVSSSVNTPTNAKAGSIASSAKYIDADRLGFFSCGASRIQKSGSCAIIDTAGNIIVPFSKYSISDIVLTASPSTAQGTNHGIFQAIEVANGRKGFLNYKGSFYPKSEPNGNYMTYMCSEYLATEIMNGTCTYMDNNWRTYTMSKPISDLREGVGVSYTAQYAYDAKKGYKKLNGQYVIQPQYDFAKGFYDGRAVVGKKDEYGAIKYGFIDKSGKEIFPLVLSNEPSHFCSGLARIVPKDQSEFDYAYINRDGKVIIKMKTTQGNYGSFYDGYAISRLGVQGIMDTTGKIISFKEFLGKFGVSNCTSFLTSFEEGDQSSDDIDKDKVIYTTYRNGHGYFGFFDIRTKKVVPAVFDGQSISPDYFLKFDRTSKLAEASMVTGYDKDNKPIYREGYINEDGVFVIVVRAQSQW